MVYFYTWNLSDTSPQLVVTGLQALSRAVSTTSWISTSIPCWISTRNTWATIISSPFPLFLPPRLLHHVNHMTVLIAHHITKLEFDARFNVSLALSNTALHFFIPRAGFLRYITRCHFMIEKGKGCTYHSHKIRCVRIGLLISWFWKVDTKSNSAFLPGTIFSDLHLSKSPNHSRSSKLLA